MSCSQLPTNSLEASPNTFSSDLMPPRARSNFESVLILPERIPPRCCNERGST